MYFALVIHSQHPLRKRSHMTPSIEGRGGGRESMKGVMSSISLVITSDSCIALKKSRLNLTRMYHNLHLQINKNFASINFREKDQKSRNSRKFLFAKVSIFKVIFARINLGRVSYINCASQNIRTT